ncbi:hypothetical protein CCR94_15785 [Rhodoblastus sphagnicola]|uniref:DUF883 domain-containing protein n=1 Tax=Rhodoblastus sphagnicola TaxID=333368 RepID=A0A2S6N3T2_9HYPH|nr:hypothetical protein CCR94_15785 [Rhodoblastus sphagnicola]
MKKAGADAASQFTDRSGGAQDYVGRGALNLAKSVSENPLAALAIVAGAGYLLGRASRGGRG